MAVWHIKSGGTRVVGSGASTPGDWSNVNCFDDDSNLNEWWRILRDHMADGDEIIFYDEDDGVSVVTHQVEIGNVSAHSTAGTFTLKSRSGDPAQCRIQAITNSAPLLNCATSTSGINYVFEGLTFIESVAGTSYAGAQYILAKNSMGDVTFHNCRLGNAVLSAATEQYGALIISEAGATRSIKFTGTSRIENITNTAAWYGGGYIARLAADTTLDIQGTLTIQNITLTPLNGIRGGFWGEYALDIIGDVEHKNVSITVNSGKFNRALFNTSGAIDVSGSISSSDISAIGGTSGCPVIVASSTFNINNVVGNRITVQQESGQNSVGTLVLAIGSSAIGYVRRVEGNDMEGFSGGCVYFANGATGIVESVIARRNVMHENGAAAYSGGDGDMTIISLYAEDCHADLHGGAFFAHNHPISSTRDKTVSIVNATILNCTAGSKGNSIYINSQNATYTMTAYVENSVIRGNGTDEIGIGESGASVHTCTIDNCDIQGGVSAITDETTNGSVTATNITDDGTQILSSGQLAPDSAYRTGGNYVRYGTRDCNGRMLGLPPPIGAFGPASNPANTRIKRV